MNAQSENTILLCTDGLDNDDDGLVDCNDPDCFDFDVDCVPCFTDIRSFADEVVLYLNACPDSNILYNDPQQALGQFNFDAFNQNAKFVSLGSGGSIHLRFRDNLIGNTGDGEPDLYVYEIGADNEDCFLELKPYDGFTLLMMKFSSAQDSDMDGFYEFGLIKGGRTAFDIDSFFNKTFAAGQLLFDEIILTDLVNSNCMGSSPGADIDAVCSASEINIEICDNQQDDDGDGLDDSEDPDCICSRQDSIQYILDGNICSTGLTVSVEAVENANYTWLFNGAIIPDESEPHITLENLEGILELLIDLNGECIRAPELPIEIPFSLTALRDTICSGDSIFFNNSFIDSSGTYSYTDQSVITGCDSIVSLDLFVAPNPERIIDREICEGDFLFFNAQRISDAGTYINNSISTLGCDSTTTLILSTVPPPSDTISASICTGDSILFENSYYSEAGEYSVRQNSPGLCDSLKVLKLQNINTVQLDTSFMLCTGDTLVFLDSLYFEAGSFNYFFQNDSICQHFSVHITSQPPLVIDTSVLLCPGDIFEFANTIYNSPGEFQIILESDNACDTLVNISVASLPQSMSVLDTFLCESGSLSINDVEYTSPGIYSQVLVASNSCDSLLNINIIQLDTNVLHQEFLLCGNEVLDIYGASFSEPGLYELEIKDQDDCPQTIFLNIFMDENCDQCFSASMPSGNLSIRSTVDSMYLVDFETLEEQYYSTLNKKELTAFLSKYIVYRYLSENLKFIDLKQIDSLQIGQDLKFNKDFSGYLQLKVQSGIETKTLLDEINKMYQRVISLPTGAMLSEKF